MRSGTAPDTLSFGVELDSDLPLNGTHEVQVDLFTCGVLKPLKFFHDPDLRVRLFVLFCLCLPLCLAWYATTDALWLPSPVLFVCRQLHPDRVECNALYLFHMTLEISKIKQCLCLHVVQSCHVAQVQEYLNLLFNMVDYNWSEERVSRKGLVVFLLKAVYLLQPCGQGLAEGNRVAQLIPIQPHKVPCDVTKLLHGGDHVEPLFHQFSRIFLREAISNRTWTHIERWCVFSGPSNAGGVSRGYSPVGASGSRIANMCP